VADGFNTPGLAAAPLSASTSAAAAISEPSRVQAVGDLWSHSQAPCLRRAARMAADDGLDRQRPNTSWTARDVELADMSKFSRRSGKHSLITDGLVSSADRQARRDPAAIRARLEGSAALAGRGGPAAG
jgi:hypothetical protein